MGPRPSVWVSWPFAWTLALAAHVAVALLPLRGRDDRREQQMVPFSVVPVDEILPSTPEPPEKPPGPENSDPLADPEVTSLRSNRPAEEAPPEPVPIVTGLPLEESQLGPDGMGVRVGNTDAPGYDADVDPALLGGFVGDGAGGGDGVVVQPPPDRAPKLLRSFEPPYPDRARYERIEGRVVIEVEVLPTGRAGHVRLIEGVHPELDQSALNAVRRFRWQPAIRDGQKVTARTVIAVRFRLVD